MSDSLATYLHDHLTGSKFAIELLGTMRDQHSDDPIGAFAAIILAEVEEDREQLQDIIDRVGTGGPDLKEAAAWLAEKVSQLKLRRDKVGLIGTFQAMETLALGILGKASLWRALSVVSQKDERVRGWDYEQLTHRAEAQHAQVEEQRLQLARTAFEASA